MSPGVSGGIAGGVLCLGLLVVFTRVTALRRNDLDTRVLAYVRDLPQLQIRRSAPSGSGLQLVFGPVLRGGAERLERVLGGAASVRRRIDRAGLAMSLHDFRVEQIIWGLVAFAACAVPSVLISLQSPDRALPLLICCGVAFVVGVLLRENRLTAQVRAHERRVLEELPSVAELLALAVAAGEGPVAATERVVARSRGALADELRHVLADIRVGAPVGRAFDAYAARSGLPVVARFASAIAVSVERGTPLADVLHAQAADVREARRRALIESGARREVAMMVPVVFLIMPTTVLFAFWPGVVGISLVTP